jgi:hypothetical protein
MYDGLWACASITLGAPVANMRTRRRHTPAAVGSPAKQVTMSPAAAYSGVIRIVATPLRAEQGAHRAE